MAQTATKETLMMAMTMIKKEMNKAMCQKKVTNLLLLRVE
jgi:hypothetical protein